MSFWLPIYTLASRELVRFFRQRTRVVGALGQPIIFWILFGMGLHGSFQPPAWAPETMTYQEYFFPGIAGAEIVNESVWKGVGSTLSKLRGPGVGSAVFE